MATNALTSVSLLEFMKIEKVQTFQGFGLAPNAVLPMPPTDATPLVLATKRLSALRIYEKVIGRTAVIAPPSASGVLAGGPPATLTQTFVNEVDIMGFLTSFDAGDQTPVGQMTAAITYNDSAVVPHAITQNYLWQNGTKNSKIIVLTASFNGEIAMPQVAQIGAGNPFVIVWTGPAGFSVSTELLTSKHPLVRELFNSNLPERLIRYELNKSGGGF